MKRAVFLDRDGVLNRAVVRDGKPYPAAIGRPSSRCCRARRMRCRSLRDAGFLLIVVTNQPDVARGTQTRAQVEAMNARLRDGLPIDDILVCYHDDADDCACRKPKPGVLLEAARAPRDRPGS